MTALLSWNRDRLARAVGVAGRLRRVALLASPLAIVLLLAAAGSASAADSPGLDDVATALPPVPAVEPVEPAGAIETTDQAATSLKSTTKHALASADEAAPVRPPTSVVDSVREKAAGVVAAVDPIVPVAVPPELLPDPSDGAGDGLPPRRPSARRAAEASATIATPARAGPGARSLPTADPTDRTRSSTAGAVAGAVLPALPPAPIGVSGDTATASGAAGTGPWLALLVLPLIGAAWRSAFRLSACLGIPRGLTPQLAVPPG